MLSETLVYADVINWVKGEDGLENTNSVGFNSSIEKLAGDIPGIFGIFVNSVLTI